MRTLTTFILLILSAIMAESQTHVKFDLRDDSFGITQTTGRTVIVQAEGRPSSSGNVVLLSYRISSTTDTNGSVTFSNIFGSSISGFYHVTIPAPPLRSDFDIWVQSTNLGLISAASIRGVFGASTYPSSAFAWAADVSDQRYSSITNGGGSGTTYTNRGDLPAGVILGGAVGTNQTDLSFTNALITQMAATNAVGTNSALAAALAGDAVSSNALAAAAGIVNSQAIGFTVNTNSLHPWGGETNTVDNDVYSWNDDAGGYTNVAVAAKRLWFIAPNGHAVFTNLLFGMQYSNTVAGTFLGSGWTNTGGGLTRGLIVEFDLILSTNTSPFLLSSTMNYGQFGYGFWEPTIFGNSNYTRGLFPVKISADASYWKIGTAPSKIFGLADMGNRDPALSPKINGWYALGYTTNVVYGTGTNSSAAGVMLSSNLLDFSFFTNLSFFLPGETIASSNCVTWECKWLVVGSSVWAVSAVNTNPWPSSGNSSFQIRIRTTSTNDFPNNWAPAVSLNQATYSNLIDGTAIFTGTKVIMAMKDDSTKLTYIGSFATTNPSSPFTFSLIGDHSGWGSSWEGLNWSSYYLTNGAKSYALTERFYQGPNRGNGGDAFVTGQAISTNPLVAWSGMTNLYVPRGPQGEYLQNFQLMDLNTAEERDLAESIVNQQSGNFGLVSYFPNKPVTNQYTKSGWPYNVSETNPIPGKFSGLWLPAGSGVAVYSTSEGTNYLSATTYDISSTNRAGIPGSVDVVAWTSNSFSIIPGISLIGNGSGLTSIPTTGVSTLATNLATNNAILANLASQSNNASALTTGTIGQGLLPSAVLTNNQSTPVALASTLTIGTGSSQVLMTPTANLLTFNANVTATRFSGIGTDLTAISQATNALQLGGNPAANFLSNNFAGSASIFGTLAVTAIASTTLATPTFTGIASATNLSIGQISITGGSETGISNLVTTNLTAQNATLNGVLNNNAATTNTSSMVFNAGSHIVFNTNISDTTVISYGSGTSGFRGGYQSGFGIFRLLRIDATPALDVNVSGGSSRSYADFFKSDGGFVAGTTITATNGYISVVSNALAPIAITFPATTGNWTNTTGRNIFVFIDNTAVTGTSVKVNGTTIFSGLSTDVTLPLQNNEFFSETYTVGTPTATIKPF